MMKNLTAIGNGAEFCRVGGPRATKGHRSEAGLSLFEASFLDMRKGITDTWVLLSVAAKIPDI